MSYDEQQDLSRQLSRAGRRLPRPPAWVELAAVRRNIPKDGVLVDIVRFQPFVFGAKQKENQGQPTHYAAWLTPPAGTGDVRVIDLGKADKIDAAVGEYQAAMAAAKPAARCTNWARSRPPPSCKSRWPISPGWCSVR